MEDQEYTNPFAEVHRKAKAFKDRASEANKNDAELRKSRAIQEASEILDKDRDQPVRPVAAKGMRRPPGTDQ